MQEPRSVPGGGGGIAFYQLSRSPAELHLFTAFGNDDAARDVEAAIRTTGAQVHAARRDEHHTRDVVMLTPSGERTIIVVGEPLHPRHDDALPWELLETCDAAYFAAQDPEVLRLARGARLLVVTARRAEALRRSGVRADVVVGSARDPREASTLADYDPAPGALVMTEGGAGGRVETADGVARFAATPAPERVVAAYGAGESFAGALVWFLACGLDVRAACGRAALQAAAVLAGPDPLSAQMALTMP